MAYASISYPATGTQENFTVPFPYIHKDDIKVYINDVAVGFTWFNNSTVKVTPAPDIGLVVKVVRSTKIEARWVDFQSNVGLTSVALDKDGNQSHFLIQELRDDINQIEAGMLGQTTIDLITDNAAQSTLSSQTITDLQTGLSDLQAIADGVVVSYYQATEPTEGSEGDWWIDTDNGNELYRHDGISWVSIQDAAIQAALLAASQAADLADSKVVTFWQDEAPSAGVSNLGDLWFDTNDDNYLYRFNGVFWEDANLPGLNITHSPTAPSNPRVGDVWYDSDDNNKSYQWNGTVWSPLVTTIHGSLVVDNTIIGSKILAGAISATHLSVSQLSAISADLGTVTAGNIHLTSGGSHSIKMYANNVYAMWYGTGAVNDANALFYLKNDGSVVFKGTLQAASGSFAGDISAATGTFSGLIVGTAVVDTLQLKNGATSADSSIYTEGDTPIYTNLSGWQPLQTLVHVSNGYKNYVSWTFWYEMQAGSGTTDLYIRVRCSDGTYIWGGAAGRKIRRESNYVTETDAMSGGATHVPASGSVVYYVEMAIAGSNLPSWKASARSMSVIENKR